MQMRGCRLDARLMVPAVGGVLAVIAKKHCSHLNAIKRPK